MLRFLTYTSQDPDEQRRGTLFNIFLVGISIPVLGLLGINTYEALTQAYPNALAFVTIDLVSISCLFALWFLHRLHSRSARHLFLLFLTMAAVSFFEVHILDRVLVTLTIPVMIAAFLIRPPHSFTYAIITGLAYSAVVLRSFTQGAWGDQNLSYVFNHISLLSLFVIAFIAWLVSRSLDQALAEARHRADELKVLNEELDQRVRDRTRELAEALRREHASAVRNQTILESIGDGVLVTNSHNHIIVSNPAADRLAHHSLTGRSLQEALADIQAEVLVQIENYMAEDTVGERPNIQFEWNKRTVAANIAPVSLTPPGQEHSSGGNVMVLRDVTREAELDRMKTIFLGSVSHELRTPMAAIKGYVDILLDPELEKLSATGRKYLAIIDTNIKRLLSLANDLIDMSRLEVGEIALYCRWTEPGPVVLAAVDTVKQEFERRGLSLAVQIDPDLPPLYLDRNRIIQVLLNLLTNAYKYTVEGGATVKVSRVDEAVEIEVADTGVGMTEEEQAHLFERFFRARRDVVQKAEGSGLGLVIARGLVELHGGTIECRSEYNAGTTFKISLPVTRVPEPA